MTEYAGHPVWQMDHGLFWNATPAELESAYEAAVPGDIVAVVTHVSNYEDAARPVENYFPFLGSADPSENSLVTVSEAMGLAIPQPSTMFLLAVAAVISAIRHPRTHAR